MGDPEMIELDGHELAVPDEHPSFSARDCDDFPVYWDGDKYRDMTKLGPWWKSIAAAQAFTYWMLRSENWYKCYDYAMEWARWGGLISE